MCVCQCCSRDQLTQVQVKVKTRRESTCSQFHNKTKAIKHALRLRFKDHIFMVLALLWTGAFELGLDSDSNELV